MSETQKIFEGLLGGKPVPITYTVISASNKEVVVIRDNFFSPNPGLGRILKAIGPLALTYCRPSDNKIEVYAHQDADFDSPFGKWIMEHELDHVSLNDKKVFKFLSNLTGKSVKELIDVYMTYANKLSEYGLSFEEMRADLHATMVCDPLPLGKELVSFMSFLALYKNAPRVGVFIASQIAKRLGLL